jgi:hypothetical protein
MHTFCEDPTVACNDILYYGSEGSKKLPDFIHFFNLYSSRVAIFAQCNHNLLVRTWQEKRGHELNLLLLAASSTLKLSYFSLICTNTHDQKPKQASGHIKPLVICCTIIELIFKLA